MSTQCTHIGIHVTEWKIPGKSAYLCDMWCVLIFSIRLEYFNAGCINLNSPATVENNLIYCKLLILQKSGTWPSSSRSPSEWKASHPKEHLFGDSLSPSVTWVLSRNELHLSSLSQNYTVSIPKSANTKKNCLAVEFLWESIWDQFLDFRPGNVGDSSPSWQWVWTPPSLDTSINCHGSQHVKLDPNSIVS